MMREHEFDKAARIAAEMELKDYVEKLEAIAGLTRRASVDGKTHMINVSVEHVENQALFTAKYGGEGAKVVLNIEEMWRYALLANLATMIVPDFDVKGVRYVAYSHMRAADRLLMLGVLVPGEHMLSVRRIGSSPIIEVWSDKQKIFESPIHRLVLDAAREMGSPDKDYTLAIAWLFISAILNTPDDEKPSKGLAEFARRLAVRSGRPEKEYKMAFESLRPYVEGLDVLLAPISRGDRAFLIGKIIDYKGRIIENRAIIYTNNIDDMVIRTNGVEINMVDAVAVAINAFKRLNTLRGLLLLRIPPIDGPAIKAVAALRVRERRLNELLEYGEPIKISDVEIVPVKAKEIVVEITPENLSEIMNGFRERYYTRLRLTDGREKYDLYYHIIFRTVPRFAARAKPGLVTMMEKVGIRPSKRGDIAFTINRLPELLSAGIKAYAVRVAKNDEVTWIIRIGDIELKMFYDADHNYLWRWSEGGKIPAIIDGRLKWLDLRKLVGGCEDCPERRMAEALNAAGIKWDVSSDAKYLFVYPPRR